MPFSLERLRVSTTETTRANLPKKQTQVMTGLIAEGSRVFDI